MPPALARTPRRRRTELATLVGLAALCTAPPEAAAVTVITVSSPTLAPQFSVPEGFELLITTSGQLLSPGPGTSILIAGNTINHGLISTGWSTQSHPVGLTFLGSAWPTPLSVLNAENARTEAAHLHLLATTFDSVGRLTTGAITISSQLTGSPQAAIWPALTVGNASVLQIYEGTAPNALWENYGDVRIHAGGRINIDGGAYMRTLPATSPPVPFGQVFEISAPLVATGVQAGQLFLGERGGLSVQAGYDLRNGGVIENTGSVHVLPDSAIRNGLGLPPPTSGVAQAEVYNSGTLLIGVAAYGPATSPPLGALAVLENAGTLSSSAGVLRIGGQGHLFNTGRVEVSGGRAEVLVVEWSVMGVRMQMRGLWTNELGSSTFIGSGGTLRVDGDFLQFGGRLESLGVIEVGQKGRVQLGGETEFQAGSTFTLSGDMQVTGQLTLLGGVSGPTPLASASMEVLPAGSFRLMAAGSVKQTSSGFNNEGVMALDAGSQWQADHGANGNRPFFINRAGAQVSTAADWRSSGNITNNGSFVLEPGAQLSTLSFFHQAGLLHIHAGASLETVADAKVANSGRLQMTGGLLKGSGRINGDLFIEGGVGPAGPQHLCGNDPTPGIACFTPGNSPGTMTITGLLDLGEGAILELEISRDAHGELAWDRVIAGSMVFHSGALVRLLIDENLPASSLTTLDLLSCVSGDCALQAASFELVGGAGGALVFEPDGSLSFALVPVPEPANWALLACGLAALGAWRQRREIGARA